MRIDLHTHSSVSDGTQTPEELVRDARAAGLDVLAITDHDTAAGWPESVAAAQRHAVELVRGMEISTRHQGAGVHLLAYLPDPTHPPLAEALDAILEGRGARVPAMVSRLRDEGIEINEDDVRRASPGTAATGRPHVADALVALGVVPDRDVAFDRYLGPGRPAFVDRYAASLVDMIALVEEAGGASVIAHPWGRIGLAHPDETMLAELAAAGLSGIEVDHRDHDDASRTRLRSIAASLGLVATGSSDHHGTGKVGFDLGCHTTAPEEYERLLERCAAAAVRSGGTTPEVVRPQR